MSKYYSGYAVVYYLLCPGTITLSDSINFEQIVINNMSPYAKRKDFNFNIRIWFDLNGNFKEFEFKYHTRIKIPLED